MKLVYLQVCEMAKSVMEKSVTIEMVFAAGNQSVSEKWEGVS